MCSNIETTNDEQRIEPEEIVSTLNLDIATHTRRILNSHPELKEKKVYYINGFHPVKALGTEYKDQCTNIIKESFVKYAEARGWDDREPEDDDLTLSFELKRNGYHGFAYFYPRESITYMIAFVDNLKNFKKDLSLAKSSVAKGVYAIKPTMSGIVTTKMVVGEESEPVLNKDYASEISNMSEEFFKKRKFYIDNKLPHKRGVLLYGQPGNGKTSLIKAILRRHKDGFGFVIDCTRDFSPSILTFIRENFSAEDKKVIVFEDLDGIGAHNRSAFLNFLDGIEPIDNTFIIATSNRIERVDYALVNRPSRFDTIYHIEDPDEKTRKKIIQSFFPDLDDKTLQTLSEETEGFSGAYFKEMFILTQIKNVDTITAVTEIKKQLKMFKPNTEKQSYVE